MALRRSPHQMGHVSGTPAVDACPLIARYPGRLAKAALFQVTRRV
jgi:hypothetical protein